MELSFFKFQGLCLVIFSKRKCVYFPYWKQCTALRNTDLTMIKLHKIISHIKCLNQEHDHKTGTLFTEVKDFRGIQKKKKKTSRI